MGDGGPGVPRPNAAGLVTLYIVPSAVLPGFKVGVTGNLKQRLMSVQRKYGRLEPAGCLTATLAPSDGRALEATIHRELESYRLFKTNQHKEGYTEWYSVSAYPEALRILGEAMDGPLTISCREDFPWLAFRRSRRWSAAA